MPSTKRIDYPELEAKILDKSIDLSKFSCKKDDIIGLNNFIHKEALAYQEENLGVTYLFLYKKRIVGFVTLAMDEIRIKEPRRFLSFSVPFKEFPALLIGRLAVDDEFRRRDVGRNICLWVLGLAKELSERVGCGFVTVLTQGEVVGFYEKCKFEAINRSKKKIVMFKQLPKKRSSKCEKS